MATEIGTAYVAIVPSLKNANKIIEQQIQGGSIGKQIGQAIGSGVSDNAGSGLKKAGALASGTFGKIAKAGVGAFTGIGTVLAGLAAKGGMTRALNLEQAQQMFKGMKLDWADYKDTVNAAVDGTAFSLDQAALVAANLAASGVAAGDDMRRALDACTGTAATFGRDLGDIGSIFQKVAAQGKISGETVQQFADRGVNVTAILSEALGKSSDEIKEMVSRGKIDFKTFSDAMYDVFGDSASAANETFTGSMANMRSAISRIGEKFMTPIKDNAVPVFNSVRLALNQVNKALQPVADRFSQLADVAGGKIVAAFDGFTKRMEDGASVLEAVKGGLEDVFGADIVAKAEGLVAAVGGLAALGPVLKLAGEGVGIAAKGFDAFNGVAGPVVATLSEISGKAAGFAKTFAGAGASAAREFGVAMARGFTPRAIMDRLDALPELASTVFGRMRWNIEGRIGEITSVVSERFGGIGEAINNRLGGVPGRIGEFASSITGRLGVAAEMGVNAFKRKFNIGSHAEGEGSKLSAAFGKIKGAAGNMGGVLVKAAGGLTAVAGGLLAAGFAAVASGVDLEAAANQFMEKIGLITQNLPVMAEQFAALLPSLVSQLTAAMPALVEAFSTALSTIVQALPAILPQLSTGLAQMVVSLVPVLVDMAPMLLDAGMQLFTAIVQSLTIILPVLIAQLPAMVENVCNVLIENLPTLLEAGLTLFMALVNAFITMLPRLIEKLPDLIIRVGSKLASFAPQLLAAAGNLFQNIVKAVPKILGALLSALGSLLSQLPGKVASFAGKMATAAGDMLRGMVNGIADAGKWVIDKIKSVCSDALGAVKSFFGIASPSKVMRKMFRFVGDGMVLGLGDKADAITGAMKGAVSGALDVAKNFSPDLNFAAAGSAKVDLGRGIDPYGGKGGAQGPSQTFNIYSDDPEQVAALVAARQRRGW